MFRASGFSLGKPLRQPENGIACFQAAYIASSTGKQKVGRTHPTDVFAD
nr:hypothetical protein [uncultured Kingella sp.]